MSRLIRGSVVLTPLRLDQIESFREFMCGLDVWMDGEEYGDDIRAALDDLLDEVKRLREDRS